MNAFVGSRSTARLGGILCDSCHKYKPRVALVQVDDGKSAPTKVLRRLRARHRVRGPKVGAPMNLFISILAAASIDDKAVGP